MMILLPFTQWTIYTPLVERTHARIYGEYPQTAVAAWREQSEGFFRRIVVQIHPDSQIVICRNATKESFTSLVADYALLSIWCSMV